MKIEYIIYKLLKTAELICMSYNEILRMTISKVLYQPSFQRPLDKTRVDNISKYINSEICKSSYYLGVCLISERDNKLFILDGRYIRLIFHVISKLYPN